MSAVLTAQEPSAKYLADLQPPLVQHFDLIAQAPGGVARLRELILTLAVQGKLVPQDPSDEPASELLKKIRAEKDRLIFEGKIKRSKLQIEISADEKPFVTPTDWEWIRLGESMEMLNGKAFKPSDWLPSGLPIVRIQNLNKLEASFNYCDPETVSEKNKINDGSFLISWSGTPGTSFGAFIWQRGAAALNQHIFKCELIGHAFVPEFLKLSINSQLNVLIAKAQGGVGLQHVTKGTLESLVLVMPPLAEQSRIVTRVEELMQLCDALEDRGQLEAQQHAQLVGTLLGTLTQSETPEALADNWQRIATHFDVLLDRPEAVDALEQTILQLAVRGLLVPQDPTDEPASSLLQKIRTEKDHLIVQGKIKRDKPLAEIVDDEKLFELPESWQWTRLGAVYNLEYGASLPEKLRLHGQIPVYGSNGVVGFHNESLIQKPSLIVGRKGSVGAVNLSLGPFWPIDTSYYATPPEGIDLLYSYYLFRSLELGKHDKATAIPGINRNDVYKEVIGLPPLAEQSRIVTRVEELLTLCANLRKGFAKQHVVVSNIVDATVKIVS